MKKLLFFLLFPIAAFAARDYTLYPPHVPEPVIAEADPPQVNTFCAVNLSCTVTGAWTFSTPPTLGTLSSLAVSGNATIGGTLGVTGAVTATGNGAAGNVAIKYASADSARYVSASGNDANDGLSMGTAKATIAGAFSSLANCSNVPFVFDSGNVQYTQPCGTIYVGESTAGYTLSSTLNLTGIFTRIIGLGEHPTVLNCTVNAACVSWVANTLGGGEYNSDFGLSNITLNGNNGSAQIGLLCTDCNGVRLEQVRFVNFAGASGEGAEFKNDTNFLSERMTLINLMFDNDKSHMVLNGAGGVANNSFGHQLWSGLTFMLENGQTAFTVKGNAQLYSSFITGVINTSAPNTDTYTAISCQGTAAIKGMFKIETDNGGGGTLTPTSGCNNSNFQVWGFSANAPNLVAQDSGYIVNVTTPSPTQSVVYQLNGVNKACTYLDGSNFLGIGDCTNENLALGATKGSGFFMNGSASGAANIVPAAAAGGTQTIPNATGNFLLSTLAVPSVAGATDLGSTALPWGNLWLGTAATNNFKFQPAATAAARVVSMPDPGTNVNLGFNLRATSPAFATATTAGTCVQNTTAVAGATTSMVAKASPVSTPGVGAQWSAFVSSSGNVTINECAVATSAGGTIAFNIEVTP